MKALVRNRAVSNDIKTVYQNESIDWKFFDGKTFYITGATGTIGSFLIRVLRHVQKYEDITINIVASVRNKKRAEEMFADIIGGKNFKLHVTDAAKCNTYKGKVDYIIHAASSTESKYFTQNPVEVVNTAVEGTNSILKLAQRTNTKSVVFLSSMEVYGDITDESKVLKEEDLGELDITNPRSSYPMGKRAAEMLCVSYAKEYNVPVKIARLAQVIGANVEYDDTRVYAMFARSIVEKQDIVLKTEGKKITSQCYITDIVTGIITLLLNGKDGEIYNVANDKSAVKIRDIAQMLCDKYAGSGLKIELSDTNIYPKETYWRLNTDKLKTLGWSANVSLEDSYNKLIDSFYMQKAAMEENLLDSKGNNKKRNKNELSFAQKIFSLKNISDYKQLCLMGIKFKLPAKIKDLYKQYKKLPIQKNKIVFCNFKGAGYGCNPKYIAEEIIKRKLPYELVWLTKNQNVSEFPENVRIVNYSSVAAMKELATAKVWVDNQRKMFHIRKGLQKKPEQTYIQTFHGSLGIKRVGLDSNNKVDTGWVPIGMQDADMINFLISNSTFEDEVFEKCFFSKGEIKKCGHARNDIFFKNQEEKLSIRNMVCETLKIPNHKKIALYVPSFREDKGLNYYTLNVEELKKVLEEKYGNEWIVVIRMHPDLKKYTGSLFDFSQEYIVDGTFYPDIQELLVSSDLAITDYSSCIFDFMLSRNPGFIFATDIEKYNTERGFYYPLESTPFPVARNNKELIENIKNFDIDKYKVQVEEFLKDKGCMEDGHASERVVNLIESIIKDSENEKSA